MKKNKSALAQGLVRCSECGKLEKIGQSKTCSRCNSLLHARLQQSFQRTLAFLISSYALYIPANLFPIMTVTQLGKVGEPHTILGGIVALIHSNMLPVALLVLVASILVPLLKLLGISLLLLCVHYRWQVNAKRWTQMYRVILFVGRWSMLDIFMISILVSLVNLGGVAQVLAGNAATAFAAVVVLTMLAAKNFDPRLIWDAQESLQENEK